MTFIFFYFLYSSVLDTVIEELKKILKRDFNKRMIESTAFKTFEAWWDDQESKFKVISIFFLIYFERHQYDAKTSLNNCETTII